MRHSWKRFNLGRCRSRGRPAGLGPALLLVMCVCLPARVYARASEHITLDIESPGACLKRDMVLDAVDARLGDAFETTTELTASVRVLQLTAAEYELSLRYRTSAGAVDERSLHAESCTVVADALALLLALALNPAEPAVISPVDERTSESFVSPSFALLGELDSAVMSRFAFGLGLLLGVRVGWLELVARAQLLLPRSASERGAVTTFSAFSADLGLCRPFRWSDLTLAPCVRTEVGELSGKARGAVSDQRAGAARFQALALGGELRVRLAAPLWLTLTADLTWFLRRPAFVVSGLGEVGRPQLLGARIVLGPLLTW